MSAEVPKIITVWENEDVCWGPFTKESTADIVIKMVKMITGNEDVEKVVTTVEPWEDKIDMGLKPYRVEVMMKDGAVIGTKVIMIWPPIEEGLISEGDDGLNYFVWAKSNTEAPLEVVRLRQQEAQMLEEYA